MDDQKSSHFLYIYSMHEQKDMWLFGYVPQSFECLQHCPEEHPQLHDPHVDGQFKSLHGLPQVPSNMYLGCFYILNTHKQNCTLLKTTPPLNTAPSLKNENYTLLKTTPFIENCTFIVNCSFIENCSLYDEIKHRNIYKLHQNLKFFLDLQRYVFRGKNHLWHQK